MPVTNNQWKQKEVVNMKPRSPSDKTTTQGATSDVTKTYENVLEHPKVISSAGKSTGIKPTQNTKVVSDRSKNLIDQKIPEPVTISEDKNNFSEGQLSPGRTKGLAGFWSNQNDEVKVVKKKRFDTSLSEEVANPMVVENTPNRLEGVVRAEDPGEWQKPIEVEGGSAKNIAKKLQQDQTQGKNISKPFESEPILRVKTKDIAGKLTQQLNEPMRPKEKIIIDRSQGTILLAENQPVELSPDVIRSEVQAKDEPKFESGRTRGLLEHWKNTEDEFIQPKTSTSRYRNSKPNWILEIEAAREGISLEEKLALEELRMKRSESTTSEENANFEPTPTQETYQSCDPTITRANNEYPDVFQTPNNDEPLLRIVEDDLSIAPISHSNRIDNNKQFQEISLSSDKRASETKDLQDTMKYDVSEYLKSTPVSQEHSFVHHQHLTTSVPNVTATQNEQICHSVISDQPTHIPSLSTDQISSQVETIRSTEVKHLEHELVHEIKAEPMKAMRSTEKAAETEVNTHTIKQTTVRQTYESMTVPSIPEIFQTETPTLQHLTEIPHSNSTPENKKSVLEMSEPPRNESSSECLQHSSQELTHDLPPQTETNAISQQVNEPVSLVEVQVRQKQNKTGKIQEERRLSKKDGAKGEKWCLVM